MAKRAKLYNPDSKKEIATMEAKYEALFTPWKIGNVEIKNRIVMCPMGGTSLFGWFELGGCHFDKEAAKLFQVQTHSPYTSVKIFIFNITAFFCR